MEKEEESGLEEDLESNDIPDKLDETEESNIDSLEEEVSGSLIPDEQEVIETGDTIQEIIRHPNVTIRPQLSNFEIVSRPSNFENNSNRERQLTASEIYDPRVQSQSSSPRYAQSSSKVYTPTDEVHRAVQRSNLQSNRSLLSDSSKINFKNPELSSNQDSERSYTKIDKLEKKETRRKYPWEA